MVPLAGHPAAGALVVVSRRIGTTAPSMRPARSLDPAGSHILLAPVEALPMASSEPAPPPGRRADCAAALPESVRAVIRREGLYAAPEPPEQPRRCIHPDACPEPATKGDFPMDLKQAKALPASGWATSAITIP